MSRTLPVFFSPRKSKFVSRRTSILLPIKLTCKLNLLIAFDNSPQLIRLDSLCFDVGNRLFSKFLAHDGRDADTHVECPEHVRVFEAAKFLERLEYRQDAYL